MMDKFCLHKFNEQQNDKNLQVYYLSFTSSSIGSTLFPSFDRQSSVDSSWRSMTSNVVERIRPVTSAVFCVIAEVND